MLPFLRLIRLPNLLIIAIAQVLIRYFLILPAFKAEYFVSGIFPHHLSELDFYLLVFSTLLLAGSGYVINDYFDIQIDKVNRPGKNIIGEKISKSKAQILFYILSLAGILIGFYLSVEINQPSFGGIHVFTAASLWMYSSHYKKKLLSGNIIVALLCALSLLLVGLYEPEFYRNIIYLIWYVVLAFLLTLIREIIKDMEDMKGDAVEGCKTLPIVLGIRTTKVIIQFLLLLTLAYITYVLTGYFYSNKVLNFWYLFGFFFIPFSALSYLVLSARETKDYYYAGLFTKILMITGILSILPLWYYFIK